RDLNPRIANLPKPRVIKCTMHLDLRLGAPTGPRPNTAADEANQPSVPCVELDDVGRSEQQSADPPVIRGRAVPDLRPSSRQPRQREIRGAASGEPQLVAGRHLDRRAQI